jgi:hypothetical protein
MLNAAIQSGSWLGRLFPESGDNEYQGHKAALLLLYPIALVTLGRSLVHMFRSDGGAQSIASIPLDRFTPDGAAAVILLFAYWGLSQLLIGLLYVLVLWRYRGLVPLVYLFLLVEYAGRLALGAWKPIVTLSTPPGAIANYAMGALALVMLVLALRPAGRRDRR